MVELNPKTFDLGAVLSGIDYPEKIVDVYFNEALGFEVAKTKRELDMLELLDEEKFDEAQKKFDALIEKLEQYKYVFYLKAIPSRLKIDIQKRVDDNFPQKFNAVGFPEPDRNRDELFAALMMEAYINKIVAPDGSEIVAPSLETIENFRNNAPTNALALIESEIISFDKDIAIGFETATKSADFLFKP